MRRTLYCLFSLYGKVLDVVHTRHGRQSGSAFVVFRELGQANSAMRALDGEAFYGKQLVSLTRLGWTLVGVLVVCLRRCFPWPVRCCWPFETASLDSVLCDHHSR